MNSNYYFDTSALFKRYINEAGTEKIDSIFESAGLIIISNLTVTEFVSNLKRLAEIEKLISTDVYSAVKNEFFNDIAKARIKVEPVSSIIVITSVDIIDKRYVTPIDSIQLATAMVLKESCENLIFVCADRNLCSLAEKEGMSVLMIG